MPNRRPADLLISLEEMIEPGWYVVYQTVLATCAMMKKLHESKAREMVAIELRSNGTEIGSEAIQKTAKTDTFRLEKPLLTDSIVATSHLKQY